jgi:hypothetical protein
LKLVLIIILAVLLEAQAQFGEINKQTCAHDSLMSDGQEIIQNDYWTTQNVPRSLEGYFYSLIKENRNAISKLRYEIDSLKITIKELGWVQQCTQYNPINDSDFVLSINDDTPALAVAEPCMVGYVEQLETGYAVIFETKLFEIGDIILCNNSGMSGVIVCEIEICDCGKNGFFVLAPNIKIGQAWRRVGNFLKRNTSIYLGD